MPRPQGDQGVIVEPPCADNAFELVVSFDVSQPALVQLKPSCIYLLEDGAPAIAGGLQPGQILRYVGLGDLGSAASPLDTGELVTVSGAASISGCCLVRSQGRALSTSVHLSELVVPPWKGPAASELITGTAVGINCWFVSRDREVAPGTPAIIHAMPAEHQRGDGCYIVKFGLVHGYSQQLQALHIDQMFVLAHGMVADCCGRHGPG